MKVGISMNTGDIDAALDRLAAKVKSNVVTASSAAAAKEFYLEAKLRAPESDHGHWFHGTQYKVDGTKYWFESGTLRDSIYRVLSKDNTWDGHTTYHVAWNHRKAPYGFMVEFGTSKAPAHPFLRPAFEAAKQDAIHAATFAMKKAMQEEP